MCIKCICQALNPLLVPWHALKFNLQLAICCFMPILPAVVVIVGTLIATTCTQPPHLPSLLSKTYHGNKQLVDLYYKIIFTPSSRHKKQKTSRGSFAAAVRRCRSKHRERGGARERKREGSSAVKLALNYLARSWFPPPSLSFCHCDWHKSKLGILFVRVREQQRRQGGVGGLARGRGGCGNANSSRNR